jgi:hypothetical protein
MDSTLLFLLLGTGTAAYMTLKGKKQPDQVDQVVDEMPPEAHPTELAPQHPNAVGPLPPEATPTDLAPDEEEDVIEIQGFGKYIY